MSAKRDLTDEEVQKMIDHGFDGEERLRNRAIFCLGISTGYRIKEVLQHKVGDVMARTRVADYVELPRRLRKGKAMGQTKRLAKFAQKALQEHVDDLFEQSEHDNYGSIFDQWLFPSQKTHKHTGEAKHLGTSHASMIFREAFLKCDISGAVATHSMRKTFAAKVYKKAIQDFRNGKIDIEPLRIVQMHLGHVNIANTISYLSFLTYELDDDQFNYTI
jgi:integrase